MKLAGGQHIEVVARESQILYCFGEIELANERTALQVHYGNLPRDGTDVGDSSARNHSLGLSTQRDLVDDTGRRWVADVYHGQARRAVGDGDQVSGAGHRHGVAGGVYLGDDYWTRERLYVHHRHARARVRHGDDVVDSANVYRGAWGVHRSDDAGGGRDAVQGIGALPHLGAIPDPVPVGVNVVGVGAHDELALVMQAVAVGIPGRRGVEQDRREVERLAVAKGGELVEAHLERRRLQQPLSVGRSRRQDQIAVGDAVAARGTPPDDVPRSRPRLELLDGKVVQALLQPRVRGLSQGG